jgi:hypothetical protein
MFHKSVPTVVRFSHLQASTYSSDVIGGTADHDAGGPGAESGELGHNLGGHRRARSARAGSHGFGGDLRRGAERLVGSESAGGESNSGGNGETHGDD